MKLLKYFNYIMCSVTFFLNTILEQCHEALYKLVYICRFKKIFVFDDSQCLLLRSCVLTFMCTSFISRGRRAADMAHKPITALMMQIVAIGSLMIRPWKQKTTFYYIKLKEGSNYVFFIEISLHFPDRYSL